MIKIVALLRSINVGGHNIIKMADLKLAFENIGFTKVKTYIQSGNVVFESNIEDKDKIIKKIEKELLEKFSYESRVILKTKNELENIIDNFPSLFKSEDYKHYVVFLSPTIDSKKIINEFELNDKIENIKYVKGALLWSAKASEIKKTQIDKITRKKFFQEMTIRNTNTTIKIFELLK